MPAETTKVDWTRVTPISAMPEVFGQIVEGRPSDPAIPASAQEQLRVNGLLGEWLGLLPPGVLEQPPWRDRLRNIQLQALRLVGTSSAVTRTLRQAGVPHVIYKGVAGAALVGATWNLRQSADVDVLVPLDRLTGAVRALGADGWTVMEDARVPGRMLAWACCEVPLQGPGVGVDLHWRLNASPLALRVSVEELIASGVEVTVGRTTLPTLNAEHSALVAAVHGTRELWWQGKWLLDLARALSVVDPVRLRRTAESTGSARSLAVGCAALFEVAPDAVPPALQPSPSETRLWSQMKRRPVGPLRRRVLKTRSADTLAAGLEGTARSIAGQVLVRSGAVV